MTNRFVLDDLDRKSSLSNFKFIYFESVSRNVNQTKNEKEKEKIRL